jgi:hypothetical protein
MMLRSALVEVNHTVFTTPTFSSKTPVILSMELLLESGLEQMRSELRPFGTSESEQSQISMTLVMKPTGFHIA